MFMVKYNDINSVLGDMFMSSENKKVVFSGVQPTGKIHLGNYLGAIKNWQPLQEQNDCLFCVVDLHSLTISQVPAELRKNTMQLLALYIACGINPENSTLFIQSHVPQHAELQWVLDTVTYIGELNRMTQFKDKAKKHANNLNMGLMNYPVLMASDILLYQTDLVPVGDDQKQHLELTRDLAIRFNNRYSDTFVVPEGLIYKGSSRIMSLQDPTAKMSKSDENENSLVYLTDDADTIRRKFKRAVTDSDSEVRFDAVEKPAISNLLTIYTNCKKVTMEEAEKTFKGVGYAEFKAEVAESVIEEFAPVLEKFKAIEKDKEYLQSVLKQGAEKASYMAQKTLSKVYRKVGLVERVR